MACNTSTPEFDHTGLHYYKCENCEEYDVMCEDCDWHQVAHECV